MIMMLTEMETLQAFYQQESADMFLDTMGMLVLVHHLHCQELLQKLQIITIPMLKWGLLNN